MENRGFSPISITKVMVDGSIERLVAQSLEEYVEVLRCPDVVQVWTIANENKYERIGRK